MHLTLGKRTADAVDLYLIYGVIVLLMLVAARNLPVLDMLPSCVFKQLAGIPCPTCGATRSLVYLARGEVTASFLMNPAVPLGLAVVLMLFLAQATAALHRSSVSLSLTPTESTLFWTGIVSAFMANWALLIFFNP